MSLDIRVTDSDRAHRVDLLSDGTPISWLSIIDHEVKVGSAYLRMGGIGGVGTLEEHRMKGYSRRVLEHSIDYMTKNGYDISMLYGIPDYYSKWGYSSTLPEYKITMPLRNARRANPGLNPRPMTNDDANRVLDIYESTNELRTGPVRRPRGKWLRFRKGSDWRILADGTVFEDDSSQIVGYYAADRWPRVMRITEVGATEVRFYENMLGHASKVADQRQAAELEIFVPSDHEFANLCKRMGCTFRIEYQYDAMGMGRIINVRSTMEKLRGELSRRLDGSGVGRFPPRLAIKTEIGSVTLKISGSGLDVSDDTSQDWVDLPQCALMQLVLGYRTVADVLADPAVKSQGNVYTVLGALFPAGNPYIWLSDWF